jgi:formylglycine-generating enzyme required for sulfatase activity
MKILILASNPRKDLNLDREIRDLKAVIEKSRSREQFEVVTELAVRVEDLQELMLKHEPQILHFCGHGGGEEGLVFESDEVKEQWLKTDSLSNLFRLCVRHLECVLLNACYSEVQANAIIEHINYVIGMSQTIQDNAAIAFSKGFYRALGYNRPITEAYEFGCNAIQLEITGSSKVRSAATEAERGLEVVGTIKQTAIPEHLKPILRTKPTPITIAAPAPMLTQETREAIQSEIAQSLTENSGSDQYRAKVREALADRTLTKFEEIRLEQLREKLGLTQGEANQILAEEWQPIKEAQAEYRDMLTCLIREGYYPFDADTENELQQLRQELELTDREIADISQPIFDEYHAQKVQQTQKEYEDKLQRYEQEFRRAIVAGYPIEEAVRTGLSSFQQLLGLSNEEVTRIEQPLIAPKKVEYSRKQKEQQQHLEEQQRKAEAERKAQESAKTGEKPESKNSSSSPRLQQFSFDVITVNWKGNENSRAQKSATFFTVDLGNGVLLEMVNIPCGNILMGSPDGQGSNDERPQHSVTVPAFSMGKYPVTQAQWRAVAALPVVNRDLNPDPSNFKGDNCPVEQVSWDDAVEFCNRLSKLTQTLCRLPSEAEWEYACRAGTSSAFYFGETLTPKLARCKANLGMALVTIFAGETAPVGSYLPNAFGLYDMHGNVWEWCLDHWHTNYEGAPDDGSARLGGDETSPRLARGGSWYSNPWVCRSAYRNRVDPDGRYDLLGFRLVCVAPWTH